jgi:hypothetical protein
VEEEELVALAQQAGDRRERRLLHRPQAVRRSR